MHVATPRPTFRLWFLPLFLFGPFFASGQGWMDVGVKAMYGLAGFYNNNMVNDAQHTYSLRGAPSFGAVAGLNFGSSSTLNVEGLLLNNRQEFDFRDGGTESISTVEWNNLDLYLLYRHYFVNTNYIEFGPKLSLVRSTEQSFANQVIEPAITPYSDQYYSAVAGFGSFLAGNESMTLKMGLRFEYAVSDLVSDDGEAAGYPAFYTEYADYTQSHPFRAGVFLELNFAVGPTGKRICGRRRFVFDL